MKLIGSLASPYVRKVRVVMAEKKLDYALELEDAWAGDTRIAEANPLGKVPCLLMEDGSAIYDSRVIAEYLDTLTPVCKLLPPVRQLPLKRFARQPLSLPHSEVRILERQLFKW